jgi:dolichol-phosphate mannosyltransferase
VVIAPYLRVRILLTRLLVVIPTYNERENIRPLIQRLREVFHGSSISGHILVVDDNSPDGTADLVSDISSTDNKVHLYRRSGKMGIGSAYIEGFRWGTENVAPEIFVQIDADLSHPPEKVIDLANGVLKGNDVCLGSRYDGGGGVEKWPTRRKIVSKTANWLANKILRLEIKDATTGFRALNRKAVETILDYRVSSKSYSYQIESLYIMKKENLAITTVPYFFSDRKYGKTKLGARDVISFLSHLISLRLFGVKKSQPRLLISA